MEYALSLNHYLFISGVLFSIGFSGIVFRKNILVIFMCLELMLSAANLTLIAFSKLYISEGNANYDSHVLVFFVITIAAAEIAVGIAMVIAMFRAKGSLDSSKFNLMKF